MITLMTILFVVVFLRIVWAVFRAGLRLLGWLLGSMGFLFSIFLAVTVMGFVFHVLPFLLLVGLLMIAREPA